MIIMNFCPESKSKADELYLDFDRDLNSLEKPKLIISKMLQKTQFSNVNIRKICDEDKENWSPYIVQKMSTKLRKKKFLDENRVLRDITS